LLPRRENPVKNNTRADDSSIKRLASRLAYARIEAHYKPNRQDKKAGALWEVRRLEK
jgi:hypothetical protein